MTLSQSVTMTATTAEDPVTSPDRLLHQGPYKIISSPSRLFPFERHPSLFQWSLVTNWAFWSVYLAVELLYIRRLSSASSLTRLCLWTGFLAELALFFVDANWSLDAVISSLKPQKQGRRPHYRLVGDDAPFVDVFVTTCGEPVDVLVNTIRAAAAMDYPGSRYRVSVLDDGHDGALREAVEKLAREKGLAAVKYLSREGNAFFKAGNLNFGIQETDGEFLASLDADIIVSPDFLRNLVPHLLLDPKIGLATSPQNYYSVPTGDPLAQQTEFSLWNTIFEPIHDFVGEAMCMGTGFVVRRAALESIGGWPLASSGEDYMCSTKLVEDRWKIAFVRENHQHGIAPGSFQSRMKQRLRWIDAAFEVHSANNWYLGSDSGIGLADRAAAMIFALRDLSAVSTVLSLIALPTALFVMASSSSASVALPSGGLYNLLTTALLAAFVSTKLCEWNVYRHVGMAHLSNLQALEIWAAPYSATRCLAHFLPASFPPPTFFITGSYACPTNERSRTRRAPLPVRLTTFGLPLFVAYTAVSAAAVVISLTLSLGSSSLRVLPGHVLLLARCAWKMAVPVVYMVWPPDVGAWTEFLREDEKGVLRPKRRYPVRATGNDVGGVEMGWQRGWRDAWEVAVLAVAVGWGRTLT